MIKRARKCKAQDMVSLSSEGLNKRLTSHTVKFFKQIFNSLFQ